MPGPNLSHDQHKHLNKQGLTMRNQVVSTEEWLKARLELLAEYDERA